MQTKNKDAIRCQTECTAPVQKTLEDFFEIQGALEYKKTLWDMYSAAVSSPETETWPLIMRGNLAFTYRQIVDLLEAIEAHNIEMHFRDQQEEPDCTDAR